LHLLRDKWQRLAKIFGEKFIISEMSESNTKYNCDI